jgi:deoxyribonuclease-4
MALVLGWHTPLESISEVALLHIRHSTPDCAAVQVFFKSPMRYSGVKMSKKKMEDICSLLDSIYLVVHGSYLINFIKPGIQAAIDSVVEDICVLDTLTPEQNKTRTGVVIHLGKNTEKLSLEECIQFFCKNVREVIEKTFDKKVRLILETSTKAKNGNDVFWDIENFGRLSSQLKEELGEEVYNSRIGFCIDTAHIFASGYDIRTEDQVREFLRIWDRNIGVQRITLLHLNDSKVGVGCCRDLHQQLGKGQIYSETTEGLGFLLEWCRKAMVPVILETGGNMEEEMEMIQKVKQSF